MKKKERIKSRKMIEQLFSSGKSISVFPYKVFFECSDKPAGAPPSSPLLFGVTAGTRFFKKSVDRNRIKRLTREAFRLEKKPLLETMQKTNRSLALFFVYTGKELPDFSMAREKTVVVLTRLIKMLNENSDAHT